VSKMSPHRAKDPQTVRGTISSNEYFSGFPLNAAPARGLRGIAIASDVVVNQVLAGCRVSGFQPHLFSLDEPPAICFSST
jgi:hypothetical protein